MELVENSSYKIIANLDVLRKFIDNILPDITLNETFYVCLFARNKYCKELTHIKSDKAQLKRFTTNKERLIDKLKQLECPIGAYRQKEMIVPQQALAVYISINPRDCIKAAHTSLITLSTLIAKKAEGYNPHQHVMSDIQRCCSRKIYTDFDVDRKIEVPDFLKIFKPITIQTRGGIHVLIKHDLIQQEHKNSWYMSMNNNLQPDQVGDLLVPIPGCYQGGLDFYPTVSF